jgi:apolipoprotein N-acyltransferase
MAAAEAVTATRPLLARVLARGRWPAFVLGLLLAAAFAPADQWYLAVLCPAALFALWHGATPREAAWRGFLFTAGTFLAGTYWLYHSIHLVGQAPVWLALFLMLGLVAIMGSYSALAGYVAARWLPSLGAVRWLVALPALWVLAEWVRGWLLSGFPWLALGYAQLATPLRGYAPVLGIYGVSLAVAVSAGALAMALLGTTRQRVTAAVVFAFVWAAGFALVPVRWTQPAGDPVSVALVQGAVPQSMKWEAGQRERTMQLYADLTLPHLGADIVVWPESAVPALEEHVRPFLEAMAVEATGRGSSLVMGLIRRDPVTGRYFNSIAAWSADDAPLQWYDKRRLVPFGEFFPVPPRVREWLRLMNLPYSDFERGSEAQSPLTAGTQALAPTVCYEDAYGSEQLSLVRASSLLVNVTNDAWFGDSTAPHQHLDISRMRALESGRAMLRATNDGVTALIDHDGSIVGRLPQFEPGVLAGHAVPRAGRTPYVRYGNAPVLVLVALALGAGALARRRRPVAVAA